MNSLHYLVCLIVCMSLADACIAQNSFTIQDLGKVYDYKAMNLAKGLYHHIPSEKVNHGNTSFRNTDEAHLVWKGSPDSNGFGYFQRNRDMGQVFNVPNGNDVMIDALVLRTSLGESALLPGTIGAELSVVFFEVKTNNLHINENGTTKGDRATHGFDHQFNRCDDYIEGDQYIFIKQYDGGIFPNIPPTTQPGHPKKSGVAFGTQEGHLRYFKCKFDTPLKLKAGKRYAFMIGFKEPGVDRGIALSITTEVHAKEAAHFVTDDNGLIRWGIRREGDGTLPPTMIENKNPPSDSVEYNKLVSESMFPPNHYGTLIPTANGFPDVDTYRTLEFYLELKDNKR